MSDESFEAEEKIPSYTYDKPENCIGEARKLAYMKLVYKLPRGIRYRIEESVQDGVIRFTATKYT